MKKEALGASGSTGSKRGRQEQTDIQVCLSPTHSARVIRDGRPSHVQYNRSLNSVEHSSAYIRWVILLQNSVSALMKVSLSFLLLLLVVMVCADLTYVDHGVELGRSSLISFYVVDVGAQEMRAECNGLCRYTSITDPCEKYGFLRSSCFSLESSGSAKDGCYCCVRLSN
ncbi:hypothetical protein FHG87_008178 [Trinorchestia longiramus]|nr:hypothetical protein FHG87_008178 [Trinorchestia longiramus]